jgi:hypothetical protein
MEQNFRSCQQGCSFTSNIFRSVFSREFTFVAEVLSNQNKFVEGITSYLSNLDLISSAMPS